MTVRRLPGAGALALVLLLAPRAAFADPALDEAPTAVAPVPDASAAGATPTWLRKDQVNAASVTAPPERPILGSAAAIALALGLGLAALVLRRKKPAAPGIPESTTRIRVLSTARIGPKANAVVAEVGGRVLLLGVTDTNVARLAVLHDEPAPAPAPREPALPPRTAPVETALEEDGIPGVPKSLSARFGEVLDRALGVRLPHDDFRANPGVAALLAAGVNDTVAVPPGGRPAMVEAQAAGLVARRRRA